MVSLVFGIGFRNPIITSRASNLLLSRLSLQVYTAKILTELEEEEFD
jgi:hypothetical protein